MEIQRIEKLATDEIMSLAELKEDIYFNKIDDNKIKYYIEESIKRGENVAGDTLSKYKGKNIKGIYEEKNIEIQLTKEELKNQIIKLRAKYDVVDENMIIYYWSVKDIEKKFNKLKLDKMFDYEKIIEIQLAHELFHYLETEEIGTTYEKLEEVTMFKIGPIKKTNPIKKTSDIAAHIFCKKMLDLPFHPKIMDYCYLIGRDYIDIKFLEDYFIELKEDLNVKGYRD